MKRNPNWREELGKPFAFEELHVEEINGEPFATLRMEDQGFDPFHVTYDEYGSATIHCEDLNYLILSPSQIKLISDNAKTGADLTASCYDEDGEAL